MSNDARRVRFRQVVGPPPASSLDSDGTLTAASLDIIPIGPGALIVAGRVVAPDVSKSAVMLPRT